MRSLRTKTTLLNLISLAAAITITTAIGTIYVAHKNHESCEEELYLLCKTAKSNLNYYFESVEQSTNTVASLVDNNIDALEDATFNESFANHVAQAELIFKEVAENTNGVFTYYYRMDPQITNDTGQLGFWYVLNEETNVYEWHQVSDITDTSLECLWFYKTKEAREAIWLPPYVTDNLDKYVVSYNIPIYRFKDTAQEKFIGVVGIEISYNTLGQQIKDIKSHKTGFAYIIENEKGSIIYHPYIDILGMPEDQRPSVPAGFANQIKGDEHHIEYTFQGVKKHAYWLKLSNDMSVVVCVPLSEVNEGWIKIAIQISAVGLGIIAIAVVATIFFARRITKPLKELTDAAERISNGDYNVKLTYKGDDEIGVLTSTTNRLIEHLGGYIEDINSLAYGDSLTKVHNKNAFDVALSEIQSQIINKENKVEFAIAILDCDDLKQINDKYGHDKGNVYLKNSSMLMVRVFKNSEVYRIGGDEFAIILQGEDYTNRKQLKQQFIEKSAEICAFAKEAWEQIKVSIGIATYDPEIDNSAEDVMIHADHLMYENKRERKKNK